MKGFLSCIIVLMILFLYSCQKGVDSPGRVASDSTFLMKFVLLDTSLPAGPDTVSKSLFSYDPSKRLVKIIESYGGRPDTTIHEFQYIGNDTLPNLVINRSIGPAPNYRDSIFLFYGNNGKVKKDSITSWEIPTQINNGCGAYEFVINGNNVKKYSRQYIWSGGVYSLVWTDSATVAIGNMGNNMNSQALLSGVYVDYTLVQVTYDSNPNPLNKIMKVRLPLFESHIHVYEEWFFQPNNALNFTFSFGGGLPITGQNTYNYRNDGFPISGTFQVNLATPSYNKFLYYYGSL